MQVRCEENLKLIWMEDFNVYNVSWYRKPNFLPAPHLIWCLDYQIPGKEFLIVLKNVNGENGKSLFL